MKILVVLTDNGPGGITMAAINFANELAKRGNKVDVLNMSTKDVRLKENFNYDIKVIHLNKKQQKWNITINSFKNERNPLKKLGLLFWGAVKKITNKSDKWLKFVFAKPFSDTEYDVAFAYRQCAPCFYFVLNCINARKKIGFVHGELRFMGDISSWQKYMVKFDKMAYVSNAVEKEFTAAYPELQTNACTIYNMFDVEKIKLLSQVDNQFCFDKSKTNIVTIARIDNDFKRIHWIPQICHKLKSLTDVPFHWYVVGDGHDYECVKDLSNKCNVEDVLTFLGELKNPYNILKHADFSVLLSKSESYGMVVIESLILGVPAVVAEYPALTEIFNDGQYGYVVEPSIESATERIKYLIENKSEYKNIKSNCDSYRFTNDIAYNQFLEAIQDEKREKRDT